MPKIITRALVVLILLAMFPPLLVAMVRSKRSELPRVHLIQDMDNQPKLRAQAVSEIFADGRAERPHVEGTVARGGLRLDEHFHRGIVDGQWATDFPEAAPLSRELIARGENRFNIYCAPCHSPSGNGQGMVAQRAAVLQQQGKAPAWVAPKAIYDPTAIVRPVGELFNIVTNGINTMSGYGPQIPEADRWAIVAWVKVLQRSQVASWNEISAGDRASLEADRQRAIEEAARLAAEEAEQLRRQEEDQRAREAEEQENEGGSESE
jgi:mono/diheme cytochrome c family protein